ncbi:6-phosphogluconolactonase [Natranaerovirga pectinivora]|uniref:6-phosphogluconolactonase n=1 Tax=Natranaerovirga pectinivora TaxID=682400 RepID=A0A4R3MGD6_9FIRM|nr:lactonase family protein [Natranaerovirga pectinivora]TCT12987.1 6-phosphogluconolactonase [Natranaerovirga pectinivora]
MNEAIAFIGTYTDTGSKGIYKVKLNIENGMISDPSLAATLDHPPYINIFNDNFLYSICSLDQQGGVCAYRINDHYELEFLNANISDSPSPSHINTTKNGDYLLSANYKKGTVNVYTLDSSGIIKDQICEIKHQGNGPNESRQEQPHVHHVSMSPDEKYLYAVDLGTDKIVVYEFNNGRLAEDPQRTITLNPGSGPRHMIFHPNNKFAYVLAELTSEIIVMAFSQETNTFEVLQYISTLPNDFSGSNLGSAIHFSQDGRFLYASNRGHNSIVQFSVNKNGTLDVVSHTHTQGDYPRDFSIDPSGNLIIVGNQNSNTLLSFRINKDTGVLYEPSKPINIPSPVCIKFIQP